MAGSKINNSFSYSTVTASNISKSVKEFNAKGDDSTNDTAALQAAIDAVEAAGGRLFIPAGTYRHTGLTITKGIVIEGEGWNTILKNTSAVNHSISYATGGLASQGLKIGNLALDHTGGGSAVDGIHVDGVSNHVVIERVFIKDAPRDGILMQGGTTSEHYSLYSKILWPLVQNPGRHGVYLNGPCNGGVLFGGRIDGGSGAGKYNLNLDDTVTGSPGASPNGWWIGMVDLPGSSPAAGLRDNGYGNRYFGLRFEGNTVHIFLDTNSGNAEFHGTYFNESSPIITDSSASRPVFIDKKKGLTGLPSADINGNATAKAFIPSDSTIPTNGIYLPAANTVGVAINSAAKVKVSDSSGPLVTIMNTTGQTTNIINNVTDGTMIVAGGTGTGGGYVQLYGSTHATQAKDIDLKSNGSSKLLYDDSDAQWEAGADLQFTSSADGIMGVTDASSATAGRVGEVLQATASSVNATGTGQRFDICSLALTAGDWLVTGQIQYNGNGATVTANAACEILLTTTSGNNTTGGTYGQNYYAQDWMNASSDEIHMVISNYHVNVSGSTTYYLKGRWTYSAGTPQAYGRITAVRIR